MKLIDTLKAFVRDEEGAAALEYGLFAALIAAVIAATVGQIGDALEEAFDTVLKAID
ncbi:Flp family type IVb pilin [uncultured Azohydromonas sp.]|jgi:Flp pilus assembly protein, pilin Flp|uniref:Flp family type IVb pilin n=1 Tax=uncultured Azohydromonas sp. TaxID=487342 RepID=UPI0026304DEC|nr:Flp family type IVb pilin [uncultured Azohydromonas sp.]